MISGQPSPVCGDGRDYFIRRHSHAPVNPLGDDIPECPGDHRHDIYGMTDVKEKERSAINYVNFVSFAVFLASFLLFMFNITIGKL